MAVYLSRAWLHACTALLVLALAGCAAVPRQTYNKEANAHVKTITVVMPAEPAQYLVNIVHHPGMQFGLVGGLVAASEIETKSTKFTEAARQNNIGLSKGLAEKLSSSMKYKVAIAEGAAGRKEFLESYAAVQPAADAYLDIVFRQAGYSAQHPSTPYVPTFTVPVRLVESKTNKVLYSTLLIYGEPNKFLESVNVPPDRSYSFSNFDALMAENPRAVEGLQKALDAIATQIASELQ
jgi:hypothetical protein